MIQTFDVVIIGAGVSGIGAACHLKTKTPGKSFQILESRGRPGGTWDLFRYPGIRSDSDMYTFGYKFKPWTEGKDIADGSAILNYLKETLSQFDLEKQIRFNCPVQKVQWDSTLKRWHITAMDQGTQTIVHYQCRFLLSCTGYYRYAEGYVPPFEGMNNFRGDIAHPQHWPEDLDYSNKNVIVIGSGATAITLVPSLAEKARHVTMLQRSPSYIFSRPAVDAIAKWTNRLLPTRLAYQLLRAKNILLSLFVYSFSRKRPEAMRAFLRNHTLKHLGSQEDVDKHFNPHYQPWDQRMCLIPDADLFKALRNNQASIVTDHIKRFTETGIELTSGKHLEADIIVPATGLQVQFMDGIELMIDDRVLNFGELLNYRGMMFDGIPNMAAVFGYTNASWTLKADLTAEYVCRLINYMDAHQFEVATPSLEKSTEPESGSVENREPIVNLSAGYILRALDSIPKQGRKVPWRNHDNYIKDRLSLTYGKLDDGVMQFS